MKAIRTGYDVAHICLSKEGQMEQSSKSLFESIDNSTYKR